MNSECGVTVCPSITVSDNYSRLTNKPKINGVELEADKSVAELGLLSREIATYKEMEEDSEKNESFLIVLTPHGEPSKIKLGDVTAGTFSAVEEPDLEKMKVGEFIFKKLEE